jgi:sugar O-acyltransferase (sialic acid O-acetyltransferase NeuD family)
VGEPVAVIGAGGHAKVVVATLQAAGCPILAAFDDDERKWGTALLGVPVRGPVTAAPAEAPIIIGVGDNRARAALASRLGAAGACFATAVHPLAWVHASVTLGPGTVVFARATVQPDASLGAHVIVNTAASIDHDCVLGDFVHVAPGVLLAGGVTLEEGAFLGIGAAAIPGVRVGAWARVGAGGVVVDPVPAGLTAVGLPARPRARQ